MLFRHSKASARFRPIERCSPSSPMSASDSRNPHGARTRACRVRTHANTWRIWLIVTLLIALCAVILAQSTDSLFRQSQQEADSKSSGCVACHGQTDTPSMHPTGTVHLGCTDCHGGKSGIQPPAGAQKGSAQYDQAKKQAHPQPSIAGFWRSSANPVRPFTQWLKESKEYIQF